MRLPRVAGPMTGEVSQWMAADWLLLGPLRRRTNTHGMATTLRRMKEVVEA